MRSLGFVCAGLLLFALPFLSLGVGGHVHDATGPHLDHWPRHGGQLMMVGDSHLEIVDAPPAIEVYASDARRWPLTPRSARVALDGTPPRPLDWERGRLVAPAAPDWRNAAVEVTLPGGQVLAVSVARADIGGGR
ncbi:MAG: hypothetical protein SF182_03330 [Deltaproteobacteria bacterium]|nr:hypothetical protein [Deltaproteobacteria bacterium]